MNELLKFTPWLPLDPEEIVAHLTEKKMGIVGGLRHRWMVYWHLNKNNRVVGRHICIHCGAEGGQTVKSTEYNKYYARNKRRLDKEQRFQYRQNRWKVASLLRSLNSEELCAL